MAERSKELYLKEYERIPRCTAEENAALFLKKASGDPDALNRMVEGNMFRVNEAASAVSGDRALFMDLVQEGSLALFMALAEEESMRTDFDSWLDRLIFERMQHFLKEEQNSRKAGEELSAKLNLIDQACVMLAEKYGREATAEEVAEVMEMEADDVRYLMQIALSAVKKAD